MRFTKYIAFLLISLFIIPCLFPSCTAADEEENNRPLTDLIMKTIFKMGTTIPGLFWYHQEFIQPSFYTISPQVIDLEYLNVTEFEITEVWANGTVKKAAFEPPDTPVGIMQRHIFVGQTFKFELTPPENTSTMWFAQFEPDVIEMARDVEAGDEVPYLKTKCRLSLELPPDASFPQQDTTLHIKITRTDISGNLWIPPKGHPIYGRGFGAISWIIGAILNYGKYSGTSEEIIKNVSVLVRVSKFHKPSFIPPEPIIIDKNEIKSVPVEVQNLGSHIDTFNFRIYTDAESDLTLSPPPALTLKPGDKATVSLGIATPRILRDPGSVHEVTIEMYSVDDPENVFTNTFTITTAGMYIPFFIIYYLVMLVIFILVVMLIYKTVRNRLYGKVSKKPDKPWKIPKEKEYLEKLKKKDKEKYNEILSMMEEEYKSSLLWHKYYCSAKLRQKKASIKKEKEKKLKEKEKIKKEKREKILEDIVETKKKQAQILKEAKPKKPEAKEILPEEPVFEEEPLVIDIKTETERRKEQALLRIKREQEKQKRKLGKSV